MLELAGPSAARAWSVSLVPADLRGMALWVIHQCVRSGQGGFVTKDFRNVTEYLLNPATDLESTEYRKFNKRIYSGWKAPANIYQ